LNKQVSDSGNMEISIAHTKIYGKHFNLGYK